MKNTPNLGTNTAKVRNRYNKIFKVALLIFVVAIALIFFYSCQAKKNTLDYSNMTLIQKQVPKDDAPVVVFETSLGTFKAVLYPDEAPEYCKYFTKLVNDGYYNDTYVFAVQDGVYFMGGSKANDGVATSETDTNTVELEKTENLLPIKGALCAYSQESGMLFFKKKVSSSYLLFVNNYDLTDEEQSELDEYVKDGKIDSDITKVFEDYGGVMNWVEQHTIFGQVYDGYDVYEKISTYDVKDEENCQPVDDIKFEKVYMSTYGENKNDEAFKAVIKDSSSQNDDSSK